jgi:hypothetical protein
VVIVDDDEDTTSSEDAVDTWAGVELLKLVNSIIVSFALADWSCDAAWGCWSCCAWDGGCTDFLFDSMVMTVSFNSAKFPPRAYRLITNELDATSICLAKSAFIYKFSFYFVSFRTKLQFEI